MRNMTDTDNNSIPPEPLPTMSLYRVLNYLLGLSYYLYAAAFFYVSVIDDSFGAGYNFGAIVILGLLIAFASMIMKILSKKKSAHHKLLIILFLVSLVAFTYTLTDRVLDSGQETRQVAIASYSALGQKKGESASFASIILNSAQIKSVSVGSVGWYVYVSSKDADRARYLLAKGLINQPLKMTLVVLSDRGNSYHKISPKEVIKQYEATTAEQILIEITELPEVYYNITGVVVLGLLFYSLRNSRRKHNKLVETIA